MPKDAKRAALEQRLQLYGSLIQQTEKSMFREQARIGDGDETPYMSRLRGILGSFEGNAFAAQDALSRMESQEAMLVGVGES